MKLIVGLGNPGKEYQNTRHNTGFMVIDEVAKKLNVQFDKNKYQGLYTKIKYQDEDVILLKPQTFMNLSGEAVSQIMNFFKIEIKDLLVIYDDLDLPVGKLRLRQNGSAGGHNGLKNIILHLHSQEFNRLRVGIGRHPYMKVVDYVLSTFKEEEAEEIKKGITSASEAVLDYLDHGFTYVMNKYN